MYTDLPFTSLKERSNTLQLWDLGKAPYQKVWDLQKALVEERARDEISDTLLFVEHDPEVITLGRGLNRVGTEEGAAGLSPLVQNNGIQTFAIERGGLATWHGPGQLVVYPIFKLGRNQEASNKRGVVDLIRWMEDWVIRTLNQEFHLNAGRVEGKTGVWVNERYKVCSIGIAARHWVSFHGLALNFSCGQEPWRLLNPCGLGSQVMNDLSTLLNRPITYQEALNALLKTIHE